jgi:ligand-binding sensor domain-containing protein
MILWMCLLAFAGSQQVLASEVLQSTSDSYTRRVWRNGDGLPEDFAQAMAQTPDGYLWVGTSGGLVRFDGATFAVFNREQSSAFQDDSVYSLLVTRDGTLWAGTEGGGAIRYKDHTFRNFGASEGLTNGFVRVIFEDSLRRLWVGTDAGLFRLENEHFERIDDMSVHAICEDSSGRLLIGGWGLLILNGARHNTSPMRARLITAFARSVRLLMVRCGWER